MFQSYLSVISWMDLKQRKVDPLKQKLLTYFKHKNCLSLIAQGSQIQLDKISTWRILLVWKRHYIMQRLFVWFYWFSNKLFLETKGGPRWLSYLLKLRVMSIVYQSKNSYQLSLWLWVIAIYLRLNTWNSSCKFWLLKNDSQSSGIQPKERGSLSFSKPWFLEPNLRQKKMKLRKLKEKPKE